MSMRIRQIKPGICHNEHLAALGPYARILFENLWMLADRDGRFEWRPLQIWSQTMALYSDAATVESLLDALWRSGFLARYEVAGEQYGEVVNWARHQRPDTREAKSDVPAPTGAFAPVSRNSPKPSPEPQGPPPGTPRRPPAPADPLTCHSEQIVHENTNGKNPPFKMPTWLNEAITAESTGCGDPGVITRNSRESRVTPGNSQELPVKLPGNLELRIGNKSGGVYAADSMGDDVRKSTPPPPDGKPSENEQTPPPLKKEPSREKTPPPVPAGMYRSPVPTDEEIDKALAEMDGLGIDRLGPEALRSQGGSLQPLSQIAESSGILDFEQIAAQSRQEAPGRIAAVPASVVREHPVEPKQARPVSQERVSDAVADFALMRQSLADLAKRVNLPVPDDQMVAQVLDAGHGASAVDIHMVLTKLYKRDRFKAIRSWGLVPVVVAGCFTQAATA